MGVPENKPHQLHNKNRCGRINCLHEEGDRAISPSLLEDLGKSVFQGRTAETAGDDVAFRIDQQIVRNSVDCIQFTGGIFPVFQVGEVDPGVALLYR